MIYAYRSGIPSKQANLQPNRSIKASLLQSSSIKQTNLFLVFTDLYYDMLYFALVRE